MDKMQFGRLLISLRKQHGMSQREMAGRLAVSASAVSKWEHGSNLPDMVMLNRIAELLAVSCDDLMNPKRTLERMEELPLECPPAGEQPVEDSVSEDGAMTAEKHAVKGWRMLALAAAVLILLGVVGGIALKEHLDRVAEEDLGVRPIAVRYREDSNFGKMFEIAYVMEYEMDFDEMDQHVENLKGVYKPGRTVDGDTKGIWIYYYDNEADAAAWRYTDFGTVFFFIEEEQE